MAQEIERKFLVRDPSIIQSVIGIPITQGYICKQGMTVRVRRAGDHAFLTLKGPQKGITKDEFEYAIPVADAMALMDYATGGFVSKVRYLVPHGGHTFEVDVFQGPLAGLVLAEVELDSEDSYVDLPNWLGREVSSDMAYANSNLAVAGLGGNPLPPFQ